MAGSDTDEGDAIFSTHLHRFQSRGVELPARIILRSSPEDDMEATIADLQAKYPAECKAINAPITNLYKYFDAYDQQLHGERFLHTVLTQIFERNVIRGHAIQEYARVWHTLNPTAFPWINDNGFNAFTDDDVEVYGKDFLEEVLQLLQQQKRVQEDIQANEHVRVHGNAFLQAQEYIPQVSTARHPIYLPQRHQSLADDQYNRWTPSTFPQTFSQPPSSRTASSETYQSAPSALPPTFGQPDWSTPSISAPTPEIPLVDLPPPMSQRLQPLGAASSRPMKQPLGSASLRSPSEATDYSDLIDDNINALRNGYADAGFADLHPLSSSYRRMPAGALYQPVNTMRNPSRSRPPVHTGISNDARVLGNQGISNHRRSFGEGHPGRMNQHALDQQVQQPSSSPRFQHNYTCGALPPFAQQGHGPSNVGSIEFPPRMFLSEVNRAPAVVNQSSLRRNHNDNLRYNQGVTNGPREKGFILPGQRTMMPLRQARDTFRRPPIPNFVGPPGIKPSDDADRAYDAASVSSPTRHRISNASSKPPRTTPRKENSREQPMTPGTRAHSDTKVWIGHLRLDANLGALSRLLQPWSPNKVSGMKIAGAAQEGKSWKKNPGYVFAFDHPARATDACQAFAQGNLRFGQEFGYDVSMGPAYIPQAYEETGGSPRRNITRSSEQQGSNGPDTEPSQPAETHVGSQVLVQALPASNKREQISAELPPLETNVLHPDTESRNPEPCVPETTNISVVPAPVPTPKHSGATNDRQDFVTQDSAQGVTPPILAKSDKHIAPLPKTKTPSPKKKKGQNVKKNEGGGNAGQATQRRDMQPDLGSEEFPLNPSLLASTTNNAQHVQSVREVDLVTNPKTLALQRKGVEHSNIPVPIPEEEARETTILMQGGQLTGSTLPGCKASAHAESVSTSNHTNSAGEENSSVSSTMQPTRVFSSEPVATPKLDTRAAALQTPTVGQMQIASEHGAVHSGHNGSSPVTTPAKTDVAATEEQPVSDNAVKNKTDDIPSIDKPMPGLSDKGDVVLLAPSAYQGKEDAKLQTVPPSIRALSPEHAATGATLQTASTSLASAQSRKVSSPSSKSALPKDPKELIAVPRNPPPVRRQQPQLSQRNIKVDKSSKENGEPVGSLPMAENPGTTSSLAPNIIEDLSPSPSTPVSTMHEERSPTVSAVREASEVLVNRNQTAERAKDIQLKAEDNTEARELMSASDSVVTAGDDPFDPDTSTPQKFAAAMQKQGTDAPSLQKIEQPAVEQKKGKKKKAKKKSKKSKSSQAEPVDTSNAHEADSTAAHDKEKPVMIPIVERPFVSDEGHDLPPPSFAKRNHSSMRQRI
ncbi:MAG: hypothetical protein Q9184_004777, partial [Pyrenodesmia sp. 2 TL-2023]